MTNTNSPADAYRPITIQDVANALDIHKSTVSLALSGKGNIAAATRAKILAKAQELGYEPNPLAQRLAYGANNNVVYIFSGVLDVGLATEKILLIQRELNRHALEVPIYTCGEKIADDGDTQTSQIRQLCLQRPRAIICAAQMVNPAVIRELEKYQKTGGIVVTYDIPLPLECDQVIFDREANAYQAARYLLEQGHRKLGLSVSHPPDWHEPRANVPQSLRVQGFQKALQEFDVAFKREWLFDTPTYESGGAVLAQQFLSLNERPTGLCVVNDYVALAFMVEVLRAGLRVPDEISIVGHDNQCVAQYCPVPLTCASQPVEEIAHAVVKMMLERLDGLQAPPRTVTLQGELVERQSVAAPA